MMKSGEASLRSRRAAGQTERDTCYSIPRVERLSRREHDVLRLIAAGYSNQEIAATLVISINTVKMHIKHIYGKLCIRNRVQATAYICEWVSAASSGPLIDAHQLR
jgi:ATP/maltotriose-dependent transcriptional regulator MalT